MSAAGYAGQVRRQRRETTSKSGLEASRPESRGRRGVPRPDLASVPASSSALRSPAHARVAVPPFPVEQNYPETIAGKPMQTYVDWLAPTFVLSLTGLPVGVGARWARFERHAGGYADRRRAVRRRSRARARRADTETSAAESAAVRLKPDITDTGHPNTGQSQYGTIPVVSAFRRTRPETRKGRKPFGSRPFLLSTFNFLFSTVYFQLLRVLPPTTYHLVERIAEAQQELIDVAHGRPRLE